jgi:hypothetical protein
MWMEKGINMVPLNGNASHCIYIVTVTLILYQVVKCNSPGAIWIPAYIVIEVNIQEGQILR